jgi:hypothetical protein
MKWKGLAISDTGRVWLKVVDKICVWIQHLRTRKTFVFWVAVDSMIDIHHAMVKRNFCQKELRSQGVFLHPYR